MGSNNFFSKLASYDPLVHALHLPGANNYMNAQARDAAGRSGGGPFAGVTPTLAQANTGYAPGTAGANPNWKPFVQPQIGTGWQRFAGSMQNDPLGSAVGAPGAKSGMPGQGM